MAWNIQFVGELAKNKGDNIGIAPASIHSLRRLSLNAACVLAQCSPASNKRDNRASIIRVHIGHAEKSSGGLGVNTIKTPMQIMRYGYMVRAYVFLYLVKLKRIKLEINIVVKSKWWVHRALVISFSHLRFPFLFSFFLPFILNLHAIKGWRVRGRNMCFRYHKNHLYYLSCVRIHP